MKNKTIPTNVEEALKKKIPYCSVHKYTEPVNYGGGGFDMFSSDSDFGYGGYGGYGGAAYDYLDDSF